MKTNVKKCLFGGALLGAGLCSTASAEDVIWSYGYGKALTFAVGLVTDADGGTGGWNADLGGVPGISDAHSTGGTFGLDLAAYDFLGYGTAFAGGQFTVANDASFAFDWDTESASVLISGASEGTLLNTSLDTGSFVHTFNAGETYTVNVRVFHFGVSGAPSIFTMSENTINVVPLPPAAIGGLGMLAGLGAYRRVRR